MAKKKKRQEEEDADLEILEPIVLGRVYRDAVSGWTGIAASRHEYMNGCVRYELAGADKDGKPLGFIFDEEQIIDVRTREPVGGTSSHGGPRDNTPVERP